VPVRNHVRQSTTPRCNPDDPADCLSGLLETSVTLRYPRVQVVGLNLAGEVDLLGWLSGAFKPFGYRVEVGVYFPDEQRLRIDQEEVNLLVVRPAGEYDYDGDGTPGGGSRPIVVESTPFTKWVLGLDYSLGRIAYVNVMWVHGLVDELGAGDFIHEGWTVRGGSAEHSVSTCAITGDGETCATEILRPKLGDYLVLGVDFKFNDDKGLFRLFTIWDLNGITRTSYDLQKQARVSEHDGFLSKGGLSAVIYPELAYNFGHGLGLNLGGFVQLGEPYTKFGDLAAGGSMVWLRGTLAF
jgi:hypothetical protein